MKPFSHRARAPYYELGDAIEDIETQGRLIGAHQLGNDIEEKRSLF